MDFFDHDQMEIDVLEYYDAIKNFDELIEDQNKPKDKKKRILKERIDKQRQCGILCMLPMENSL